MHKLIKPLFFVAAVAISLGIAAGASAQTSFPPDSMSLCGYRLEGRVAPATGILYGYSQYEYGFEDYQDKEEIIHLLINLIV